MKQFFIDFWEGFTDVWSIFSGIKGEVAEFLGFLTGILTLGGILMGVAIGTICFLNLYFG